MDIRTTPNGIRTTPAEKPIEAPSLQGRINAETAPKKSTSDNENKKAIKPPQIEALSL